LADRIKGITIEIGGDTTGLNKALGSVNKEIRDTQSQLKDVDRLLKLDPSNVELLSQKQSLLTTAIEDTSKKLDVMKDAERQAQAQFEQGKISQQQYDALKREIIETEQKLGSLEQQAESANDALKQAGAAGKEFDDLGNKISDAEKKAVSFGTVLSGNLASEAITGAVSNLKDQFNNLKNDLVSYALESENATKKATAYFGETGAAAEQTQKVIKDVYQAGVGESMDQVADAVMSVKKNLDNLSETDMKNLTEQALTLDGLYGIDMNETLRGVNSLMQQFGLDAQTAMDYIVSGTQNGLDKTSELGDNLAEYSGKFAQAGYSAEEYFQLLNNGLDGGAYNLDKVNDAINEVTTRLADGTIGDSIGTYSKNTQSLFEQWKKGGATQKQVVDSVVSDIKNTTSQQDALNMAAKAFGTMAEDGNLKFINSLSSVGDTYKDVSGKSNEFLDATTTKQQKFNATIRQAKESVAPLVAELSDLATTLIYSLQPKVTSVIDKVKQFTTWFKNLSDAQKENVIKVVALVTSLGPLLAILGQVGAGVGAVVTVISTMSTAFAALGVAGGPVLLAVAAIGALILIIKDAQSQTNEYKEEARALTEQEKQNKDAVEGLNTSYQQMNEQRLAATQTAQSQAQHEEDLLAELKSITDENGKVKKGYEQRANFITGQLADALGIEIKMTGDQIQNYKDLTDSIDKLILKKEANALLSANEAEYAEAIKNRTDAFMNYNQAQKDVEDTTKKLADAQQTLNEEVAAITDNPFYDWTDVNRADAAVEGYREKLKELKQTLSEAQDSYVGYNTTIQNYEGLSAAIISGNQQAISDAITNTANQFQTAETATRDSLERQTQTFTEKYESMKAAVEQGAPGITQAQVDQMAQLVEKSKLELDKLPEVVSNAISRAVTAASEGKINFQNVGNDLSAGLTQGIAAGQGNVIATAAAMAAASIEAARTTLDSHSPSRVMDSIGHDFDSGFANGISSGQGGVVANVLSLITAMTAPLTNLLTQAFTWGSDMMEGFTNGINSKVGNVTNAIKGVAEKLTSYIHFSRPDVGPLREYEKWMPDMMMGLSKGIKDNAWRITDQLKGLTGNMSYMLNGDSSGGVDLSGIEGILNYYLPNINTGNTIVLDDGTLVGKMMPNIDSGLTGYKETAGRTGT
jgi:phage-related minor tail protein